MSQVTPDQAFKMACGYYDQAKTTIKELSDYAKQINEKFSFDIAMLQYDQILQAVLMSAAIADGNYMQVESNFINHITDHSDVLAGFNREMKKENSDWEDFTWDDIDDFANNVEEETRNKLVAAVLTYTETLSNDFVKWFAPIDAATGKKYIDTLLDATSKIILLFTAVDGDELSSENEDSVKEYSLARKMFDIAIVDKWNKAMEEFNNQ